MDVQKISEDWENGKTHGEIIDKHNISGEQEFAITLCSDGLSIEEIEQRLPYLKPGMTSVEIKAVMMRADNRTTAVFIAQGRKVER